jgi:superfamily II DNA or RNA helicase
VNVLHSKAPADPSYESFLTAKLPRVPPVGFMPGPFTAQLFPFQQDIVKLACRRGRFCVWADCGMGKTAMQLEWAHQVVTQTNRPVLILAPIAVSHQTLREAEKFGIPGAHVVRRPEDIPEDARIVVTNYERLHLFDPSWFIGVVLDESSILKSYDGKTRTAILDAFRETPYRLACSATPAPNDYMELGNHAEFVGVMTRVEMLAMFFTHDGGDTSQWRLKGHAADRFWEWVCTWAITLRKPSDLGYADAGFALPDLSIVDHVLDTVQEATTNDDGQAALFAVEAKSLGEQRQVQRASLAARVARACALANATAEQVLVYCHLNDESAALAAGIVGAVEVTGSDNDAHKESALLAFQEGRVRVLVSKPTICGFGMNFQSCAQVIFVGLSHSYESFYQSIRRCWRFGQTRPVQAHVIYDWAEGAVVDNLRRKERESAEMAEAMVATMRSTSMHDLEQTTRQAATYTPAVTHGDKWSAYLGDCVDVVGMLPEASVHYSVFSPPFASLYTYSNSDRDMGNCADSDAFFDHFRFLIRELHRVIMPGRLVSFHCMNLPTSKARDGIIGITDFRGDLIRAFETEDFIFHSEVCIWKDPVTSMQRTKALGLLHKQIVKDSAMSRQGIPDYLVTMRKRGDNIQPVAGKLDTFVGEHPPLPSGDSTRDSINIWQRYASPVWMDINPSDTLQFRHARDQEDERHICPLQLDVIRRGVQLWSNPGDTVLSPFMGIGSEGYVALEMGRKFIGVELKESYYRVAVDHLRRAEKTIGGGLFATEATA